MRYKITHTTRYTYSEAVPVCQNIVHLKPRDRLYQRLADHRLLIMPAASSVTSRIDYFGNHCSHFSIQESHKTLAVTSTSEVEVTAPAVPQPKDSPTWESVVERVRSDRTTDGLTACQFHFDSPLVARSTELARYAGQSFVPGRSVVEAALDLTARIHDNFEYDPRATTVNTPLTTVLEQRRGVCQDFAHVAIGCLRSLGLPARYVSGYLRTEPPPGQPRLVGADASHAWLSIYCGDLGWLDLDPTNNTSPTANHITVACGRDYSDVCPIKGVFVGGGTHAVSVAVDVVPQEAP